MLFERWCRREYAGSLQEVRFVHGRGGDGGVEAYALLASGDVVGLQAKWFREDFGETQVKQIRSSFEQALQVRPRLVRYCVALPRETRYVPALHAIGKLEEDLALRLGEPNARAKLLQHVDAITGELHGVREDVARLVRIPEFRRDVPERAAADPLRSAGGSRALREPQRSHPRHSRVPGEGD
ncbi:MAG TPA: hypothetical protein VLS89_02455 [Candidatus Nanopelagicales bacterium]|nr:hypothetical protein [Candidatus Nanopelagicales bacterium]